MELGAGPGKGSGLQRSLGWVLKEGWQGHLCPSNALPELMQAECCVGYLTIAGCQIPEDDPSPGVLAELCAHAT